jgi:hypothetical protein
MWVDFTCEKPFAVKVYVGGVNAVSGEARSEDFGTLLRRSTALDRGESIQDYLVTDEQYWIDGIAKRDGTVMQFVATPAGTGYSVEAQVTGLDSVCGIQLEVVPCRKRYITVRVQDGPNWVRYSLRKDEEFKLVMDAYCADKGINLESRRFVLEGVLIWPGTDPVNSFFQQLLNPDLYCSMYTRVPRNKRRKSFHPSFISRL